MSQEQTKLAESEARTVAFKLFAQGHNWRGVRQALSGRFGMKDTDAKRIAKQVNETVRGKK